MKKACLTLENGMVFEGELIGGKTECEGELMLAFSSVGCPERLTDPENKGKLLVETFPTAGIYGVIPEDLSGPVTVSGIVVRELCDTPSNFRCKMTLREYLEKEKVCGIAGIDTRRLTEVIRDAGRVRGRITEIKDCEDSLEEAR